MGFRRYSNYRRGGRAVAATRFSRKPVLIGGGKKLAINQVIELKAVDYYGAYTVPCSNLHSVTPDNSGGIPPSSVLLPQRFGTPSGAGGVYVVETCGGGATLNLVGNGFGSYNREGRHICMTRLNFSYSIYSLAGSVALSGTNLLQDTFNYGLCHVVVVLDTQFDQGSLDTVTEYASKVFSSGYIEIGVDASIDNNWQSLVHRNPNFMKRFKILRHDTHVLKAVCAPTLDTALRPIITLEPVSDQFSVDLKGAVTTFSTDGPVTSDGSSLLATSIVDNAVVVLCWSSRFHVADGISMSPGFNYASRLYFTG